MCPFFLEFCSGACCSGEFNILFCGLCALCGEIKSPKALSYQGEGEGEERTSGRIRKKN
jgi:hypothetical protein